MLQVKAFFLEFSISNKLSMKTKKKFILHSKQTVILKFNNFIQKAKSQLLNYLKFTHNQNIKNLPYHHLNVHYFN